MKRGRFEIKSRRIIESVPQGDEGIYGTKYVKYWWWVYVAPNGEIVCQSQQLKSEKAARKGIASVKRGILNPVKVVEE